MIHLLACLVSHKLIHTIESNQLHKLLSHKKKIAEIDSVCFALTKAKQVFDPNYRNNLLGEQKVHGKNFLKKLNPRAIKNEEQNLAWARLPMIHLSRMPSVTEIDSYN